MTMREQMMSDFLKMFDNGTFTRDNLEWLTDELLKSDKIYCSIYNEYSRLKATQADDKAVINYLQKEVIKKSCFKNELKKRNRELNERIESLTKQLYYPDSQRELRFRVIGWEENDKEALKKKFTEINNRYLA